MTASTHNAPAAPLRLDGEMVLRAVMFVMLSVGSVAFFEPSPYEIVFLVLVPLAICTGQIVFTRVTLLLFALVAGFLLMESLALMPWIGDRPTETAEGVGANATVYTFQTIYLFFSALLFAALFTRHTDARLRLALTAYAVSSVFAAGWGVASWLGIPGFHDAGLIEDRIAGPFKDPNVLGSYSVLGVLCLMQALLDGRRRWRWLHAVGLGVVLFGGVFLPLSRGAWGAMVFAALYFAGTVFVTARNGRTRRAIVLGVLAVMILAAVATVGVLSDPGLRDAVASRAKLEQSYDGGTTGRFGNQVRSIPMLLERPLGFGPHRFSFIFDLDPHNSYIGAFASAGWLGGLIFLLFVGTTSAIAIRLSLIDNPFRRHAQVVCPALLSAFLQAFQIDIDHWRFIYLMIGAIWGMEAARVKLQKQPRHVPRTGRLAGTLIDARPSGA